MKRSNEEIKQANEALAKKASEMLNDKNRVAKAIAYFIRNTIEDFHVKYLSDAQMRNLNPLIRNAIFTFLCDFEKDYTLIATSSNKKICCQYVLKNTLTYLQEQRISAQGIKEFETIIINEIGTPLLDLSKGGIMLAGYDYIFVPKYWEDCVYCSNLKQ